MEKGYPQEKLRSTFIAGSKENRAAGKGATAKSGKRRRGPTGRGCL
jgi:hypothetical protein